jgi:hypothetical protein
MVVSGSVYNRKKTVIKQDRQTDRQDRTDETDQKQFCISGVESSASIIIDVIT